MGSRKQEECPNSNILKEIGSGFCMGGVGSSAFHFLKGVYNSPSGARFVGGYRAFITNAPRLPRIAGSFAVLCGMHSALQCAMIHARRKEDAWNTIIPTAAACGAVNMHRGLGAIARWALSGGAIEGAMIKVKEIEVSDATKTPQHLQNINKT